MNTRRILHILVLISLILALAVSVPSRIVTAQPGPIMAVFIAANHIIGFHWSVGTLLTLTIDDPDTPSIPVDYTATATVQIDPNSPDSTEGRFELGETFRVEPGHIVTLSGGGVTKTHIVTSLTQDDVDMPGDTLWGTADTGSVVEVRNLLQRDIVRWETADPNGQWEADFSVPGDAPGEELTHDFGVGTHFMIMQNDEDGDHTQVDFRMPTPKMEVQLTQNVINWWGWPSGYPVEIQFDDPATSASPDHSITVDPESPYFPEYYLGGLPLGEDYRVYPGHIVTMTNGFLTKTHTVSVLQVTDFNYDLDTISGTAEPNAEVYIHTQSNILRHVIADGAGNWIAEFSIPGEQEDEQDTFDLIPWDEGIASVSDEDHDSTQVTWPTEMNMWLDWGMSATNWYAGEETTLTIDDPETPATVDFTASAFTGYPPGPWLYTGIDFDIGQTFPLQPGYIVDLTQISHSKTCVVSPLQISGVDYITDQVTGFSNPNGQIMVSIGVGQGDEGARYRQADADASGHWQVDFSQPGTHIIRHPNEIEIVDIVPTMHVNASESDENACFTSVGSQVRMPTIRVRLTTGEIYAQNYLPGYPVALTIYQSGDLETPIYTDTKVIEDDNLIVFEYPDTLELGAGYLVRTSDGVVTKEHTVTAVWINDVDMNLNRVYGFAETGTPLTVVAHSATVRAQRDLVAGPDGSWMADFSMPGPEPWEGDTIDLNTAYIIFGYQMDDDGDMTWVHRMLNQPPQVGVISGAADPIPVNSLIQVSTSFTDPDMGDTHTSVWDWGDGSTSEGFVDESAGLVSGSHTYSEAGVYTLQLTLCDAAGECTETIYQFQVVYDPAGGFVTGGGWILSPEGVYTPEPDLTGPAHFGFVSKNQKGTSVPTGNTEFQFHATDLNLHSDSYEWLVVTGSNYARFKGVGTINGEGAYKFMLWAGDGIGTDGADTFRIRIWEEDEFGVETVIYDNGMNQEIANGSIVVHTKK